MQKQSRKFVGNGVKTPEKTVVSLGVRRLVHGEVTPAVLTQTRFSISAGVFLVPFPVSRRHVRPGIHTRYLDATPQHTPPCGIPSDGMPPICREA